MSLVELENIRQKGEALAASGDIEGAIELYKQAGDMGEPGANLRLAGHYADVELYDMVLFYANRVVLFYNTLKDEAPLRTVLYVDYLSTAYNMMALAHYKMSHWSESLNAINMSIKLENYECCYMAGRMAYKGYLSPSGESDIKLALRYWSLGREMADDEECFFAWNHHRYDNITDDFYIGESDNNHLPHGEGEKNYAKRPYTNLLGYNVAMKRYSGHWEHGNQTGNAEMRYFVEGYDGMLYDGEVKDGVPHGDGYIGVWVDDCSEDYYEGNFCLGKRSGRGCMRKDDVYFEGVWVDDKLTGEVKCTLADQSSFVAQFADGNLDLSSCTAEQALAIIDMIVEDKTSGAVAKIDGTSKVCSVAECQLTVLGVACGAIEYTLQVGGQSQKGTISPGQSVEHNAEGNSIIITCKTKTL